MHGARKDGQTDSGAGLRDGSRSLSAPSPPDRARSAFHRGWLARFLLRYRLRLVAKAARHASAMRKRRVAQPILIKVAATGRGSARRRSCRRKASTVTSPCCSHWSRPSAFAMPAHIALRRAPFLDCTKPGAVGPYDAESDPGGLPLRAIYVLLQAHGVTTVMVMGASFPQCG